MDASGDSGRTRADARDLAPEIQLSRSSSPSARRSDLASGSGQWSFRMLLDAVVDLGRGVPALAVLGIKILLNPPPSPVPARLPVFPRPPKERSFPSCRHRRRRPAILVVEPRLRTREAASVAVGVGASERNAGGEGGQEVAHPLRVVSQRRRASDERPIFTDEELMSSHAQ